MRIQVVGAGCDKCDRLYENTVEAVALLGLAEPVEKVEDLMEMVMLGVFETPALVVDGKILLADRVPKPKELAKLMAQNA